jgi:hypothetical protein
MLIWSDVAGELKAERRALNLKRTDGHVIAHVVRVEHEREVDELIGQNVRLWHLADMG